MTKSAKRLCATCHSCDGCVPGTMSPWLSSLHRRLACHLSLCCDCCAGAARPRKVTSSGPTTLSTAPWGTAAALQSRELATRTCTQMERPTETCEAGELGANQHLDDLMKQLAGSRLATLSSALTFPVWRVPSHYGCTRRVHSTTIYWRRGWRR